MEAVLIVIPARYGSVRFPSKPLALLGGKPMVVRVWEQVSKVANARTCVATDHDEIAQVVVNAGGEVVMTDPNHPSGTDRCAEVVQKLGFKGIVINVQGDEPFIEPAQIELLIDLMRQNPNREIGTLVHQIRDIDSLFLPTSVKVVTDNQNRALYFSRFAIPFNRELRDSGDWYVFHKYLKHVGIYAYRSEVLIELATLPLGALEQVEKLEQLRWLEAGYQIYVAETQQHGMGIDTPEDLERAEAIWNEQAKDQDRL
jgi:3-deoxy-manno-octulosonate cytidylyltransferase (CMP-KDO synthetase)